MTLEVGRRLIGGIWRTGSRDEPDGGGGSQPGAAITYGPFNVTFADLKEDGDELTLLTPAAGDVLVGMFIDVETAVPWESTGAPDMAINEDPPGPDYDNTVGFYTFDPTQMTPSQIVPFGSASNQGITGSTTVTANRVFHGGPVKIGYVDSGMGTATVGSFDLYRVIATPTTP